MQFLNDFVARRPLPSLAILLCVGLLVALSPLALTTCHTRPAGILTGREERAQVAGKDRALAAARADSAKAERYHRNAQLLRTAAHLYEDSATYYATHAPLSTPAADSSYLARFWADLTR